MGDGRRVLNGDSLVWEDEMSWRWQWWWLYRVNMPNVPELDTEK